MNVQQWLAGSGLTQVAAAKLLGVTQALGVHVQTYRKLETAKGVLMIDAVLLARANFRKTELERDAHASYFAHPYQDDNDEAEAVEHAMKYVERKIKERRLVFV